MDFKAPPEQNILLGWDSLSAVRATPGQSGSSAESLAFARDLVAQSLDSLELLWRWEKKTSYWLPEHAKSLAPRGAF